MLAGPMAVGDRAVPSMRLWKIACLAKGEQGVKITTKLGIAGIALVIAAGTVSVAAISDQVEYSVCMRRAPAFNTTAQSGETSVRAGYELVVIVRGHAWATRNWAPQEFSDFELPATWAFWFKNGPRISFAGRASYSRSPGCAKDGQRFVAVGASYERSSEAPRLPGGRSIEKRFLTEGLTVSLKGEIVVLRLQNGVSFQGPISG